MKIKTKLNPSQSQNLLDTAFDVGKERLYYYSEVPGIGSTTDYLEENFFNRNEAVIENLANLKAFARQRGFDGLRIVCEPTGGFERRLLRLARKAGHHTAYVNTEAVHKLQVVQSNDANKTDLKDPRTIFLLTRLGKVLQHRTLDGPFLVLREYNVRYERLEARMVELKNRIYRILRHLFAELSFKKDWLFDGVAAQRIVEAYGLNPYRIRHCGDGQVRRRLLATGVKNKTIQRLLEDAKLSVLQEIDPELIAFYEEDLRMEFEQLKHTQMLMDKTHIAMVAILDRLREDKLIRIDPAKGLISPFMLARIVGETASLDDFTSIRQLYRYAGVNIRQRQSGTFTGQNKLSKKGRPLLRKLLNQAVMPRVTKKALFGPYYHRKKAEGMIGPKAIVAVSRKFLKMLFGIQRSQKEFDAQRVFTCQSLLNAA